MADFSPSDRAPTRANTAYMAQPRAATCALSTKTRAPRGVSRGRMRSAVLARRSMFSWTQRARSLNSIGCPADVSIASFDTTTVKPMPFRVIGNSTAPPPIVIRIPSVFILQQSEPVSDDRQEVCPVSALFVGRWTKALAEASLGDDRMLLDLYLARDAALAARTLL